MAKLANFCTLCVFSLFCPPKLSIVLSMLMQFVWAWNGPWIVMDKTFPYGSTWISRQYFIHEVQNNGWFSLDYQLECTILEIWIVFFPLSKWSYNSKLNQGIFFFFKIKILGIWIQIGEMCKFAWISFARRFKYFQGVPCKIRKILASVEYYFHVVYLLYSLKFSYG